MTTQEARRIRAVEAVAERLWSKRQTQERREDAKRSRDADRRDVRRAKSSWLES